MEFGFPTAITATYILYAIGEAKNSNRHAFTMVAQGIHGTSYNIQVRLREFAAMDGSAVCYGNWARFILYESINEKWNIVKSNS